MDIKFVKRDVLKEKPDQKNLGFGKYMTDYMFVMDWDQGTGWHDARIEPYGPISISPSCVTLHYAQETFEGLKAYRTKDDRILLFRPEMNARRMITSNERLCMPGVPEEMFVEAIEELVKVEKDWIPSEPETSLYIRPFVFATESALGVHMAISYKFMVICCPVGAYYPEGINPVKILVEDELVRAVKGGTGFTKCGVIEIWSRLSCGISGLRSGFRFGTIMCMTGVGYWMAVLSLILKGVMASCLDSNSIRGSFIPRKKLRWFRSDLTR